MDRPCRVSVRTWSSGCSSQEGELPRCPGAILLLIEQEGRLGPHLHVTDSRLAVEGRRGRSQFRELVGANRTKPHLREEPQARSHGVVRLKEKLEVAQGI